MKYSFLIILSIILLSCKKEKKELSTQVLSTNSYFKKAKEYQENKVSDSAFYYFNLAKNAFLTEKDSLGVARALVNMAIIQSDKGDYYGGIETSLEADQFIKKEIKTDSIVKIVLASNYNNLGISSSNLKDYDNSISYYKEALKYVNVEESKLVYYNNIGDVLIRKKDFRRAKNYLQKALHAKIDTNYARALNNFAKAKFLENKNYDPLPELLKALEIREQQRNGMGMNSSYATLADYFFNKDKIASLKYSKMMLNKALQNKSPDDQLEALQKIILLDPKHYLEYFIRFNSINDSLQTARNKAKNQFAVIRYDVEQKNAENQILKRQDVENEIKIVQRNFGLVALSLILITGFFWYKKRRKRLEQEKELEVKNTQLKMSKKVHDVVANGLYHMMIDVQNNSEVDKTRILNDIEKMYEESRDISHENIREEDFSLRFINMIKSYSSQEQVVLPVGYKENIWENVSYNVQLELYYIVREILVNMKKHSRAKLASVKFEKDNDSLKIKYTDNGIGINNINEQEGAGIHNTENRIDSIGGDIIFEKNPTGGLIIQITIPINLKYV